MNGRIMLDVPAKPDMGLIISRRSGQLTLRRESRNKPEKGAQEKHSWDFLRLQQTVQSLDPVCWITVPLATNCLKGLLVVYVLLIWFILNLGCGELLLFVMLWSLLNILFSPLTQSFILPIIVLVPPWVFRCPQRGCCSEQSWSHPFFIVKT